MSYPGASAEAVQKSVLAPLVQAINGVDNMTYMTSSASNGMASISIYFTQGTNPDMAAVNVQNRVAQAQAMLPAQVLQYGVSVEKRQPGQLTHISPGESQRHIRREFPLQLLLQLSTPSTAPYSGCRQG